MCRLIDSSLKKKNNKVGLGTIFLETFVIFSVACLNTCVFALIKLRLTTFPFANLQHSWEMVGKKKGVSGQKESGQTEPSEESKENRERDRDFSRRRGGPPRRGRGASRGRECMDLPFNNTRNCHIAPRGALCCIKAPSEASWADMSLRKTLLVCVALCLMLPCLR